MVKSGKSVKGPSNPKTGQSVGLLGNLKTNLILPLLGSVWTYVVAGIFAVGSYLAIAGWHVADNQIQKYVAAAISAQLGDESSPLYSNVIKAVEKMRKSDVGEISAGTFILNPSNPTYELFVYVPAEKNYTAMLYYDGNDAFPNCHHVDLAFPSRKPVQLRLTEHSLDLAGLLQLANAEAQENPENIVYHSDDATRLLSKNLHGITFQLRGQAPGELIASQGNDPCSLVPQQLRISYVTLVTPTIRIGQ